MPGPFPYIGGMTDFSDLLKADNQQPGHMIQLLDAQDHDAWMAAQPSAVRSMLTAQKFRGKPGEQAIIPGEKDGAWSVVAAVPDKAKLGPWCLARLAETLPEGRYRLAEVVPGAAAFGWLMAQYRFDRYRQDDAALGPRVLLTSGVAQIDPMVQLARATALVRDMVNIPAADMGPPDLEQAVEAVAQAFGASVTTTRGDALERGFPMIHAVGKAADRGFAPRLIELEWGDPAHPRLALVGKGICFDSGGLDIKPSSGMRLMKKDMGGAAHALALAQLIMANRLPVRLHLLIAAAENAIGANAFRPGDILRSRKGLTVEIGNTDAEGRLILGDALQRASEEKPELILDFATLTGAARVALGPDYPALMTRRDETADALIAAGKAHDDEPWRLPLPDAYREWLVSEIADTNNAHGNAFAGASVAGLFLDKFVGEGIDWAHFDTFAWRPQAKPGRPKGGDAFGLRAAWHMLKGRFGGA